jgi:hypothetical protein
MAKTKKIAFKSTDQMQVYDDRPRLWIHGDIREIDETKAGYLLKTFPDNFFPAESFQKMLADDRRKEEREARAKLEERFGPGSSSSTTDGNGAELDPAIVAKLDPKEVDLWKIAAKKVDDGVELNADEKKIMAKVDKLSEG